MKSYAGHYILGNFCWFGQNEMPKQYRQYIEGWKKLCPDYEIIEWKTFVKNRLFVDYPHNKCFSHKDGQSLI